MNLFVPNLIEILIVSYELRKKLTILVALQERLSALEECRDLGQGFQLAERDMGIRGFGNIFGEQQTGDVGNVGIDLFFEMLFESLSKVCLVCDPPKRLNSKFKRVGGIGG